MRFKRFYLLYLSITILLFCIYPLYVIKVWARFWYKYRCKLAIYHPCIILILHMYLYSYCVTIDSVLL